MPRPSAALVVAVIAIFVALGGPGYAASMIDGSSLKDRSVRARKLAKDTITGTEVNESSLGTVPSAATATTVKQPEAWRSVAPAADGEDWCADPGVSGAFCSYAGYCTTDCPRFLPWRSLGDPYAPVSFYKDRLGTVHLRGYAITAEGMVTHEPRRRPIFRLPPRYRPTSWRVFASVGSWDRGDDPGVEVAWVEVTDEGLVRLLFDCDGPGQHCTSTGQQVSLDGISFRP